MPATFTRTLLIQSAQDPGFGGKPPVARRPTGGGGDGENWENRRPGPQWTARICWAATHGAVFRSGQRPDVFHRLGQCFFRRQGSGHFTASNAWVLDWHPIALPPILWINTALMLLSTFTMEMGRRHFFREIDVMEEWLGMGRPTLRRAAPWLAATVALGGLFLAGQWIAWKQLGRSGSLFRLQPEQATFSF